MAKIRKIIRWLLFLISGLLVLSGFGITQYQTVGKLTLGFLDKAQAFELHRFLVMPFIILFLLHVIMSTNFFRRK